MRYGTKGVGALRGLGGLSSHPLYGTWYGILTNFAHYIAQEAAGKI